MGMRRPSASSGTELAVTRFRWPLAAMRSAGAKREQARAALLEVATREEVMAMGLVDLPGEEGEGEVRKAATSSA